jgi:ZIP family zinc transporter
MIVHWFVSLSPISQAALATCFTWLVTAAGAALVFFFKTINRKVLDGMLGFAAGVMVAASFWSLLAPAIEIAEKESRLPAFVPAAVGFLLGGFFLFAVDKILPHLHMDFSRGETEGISTSWRRSILLVLAITLHNFPEGLAVGVAFGALAAGMQNVPEGTAVSVPLRREGVSRFRAFFWGQLSAVVEPVAGILGAVAVIVMKPLLPYALAFAAGAMIYVVVEELVPESQREVSSDVATLGAMLGFTVMMTLDVALG